MKRYELPPSLRVQGAPSTPPVVSPAPEPSTVVAPEKDSWPQGAFAAIYALMGAAGTAAGAYHGARRNHGSIWSAVVWGFFGGLAPLITVPVAAAQGFGQPRTDTKPDAVKPDA